MATYFPCSNNPRDAASHMLYLRESLPNSYTEAPVVPSNVMMYVNHPSSSSGSFINVLAGNSEHQHQQQSGCNENPQLEVLSNLGRMRLEESDFNSWKDGRNEMLFMQPVDSAASLLQGVQVLHGQGLSLSLSTQMQMPSFLSSNLSISAEGSGKLREDGDPQSKQLRNSEYVLANFQGGHPDSMQTDVSPYGMSSIARSIPNSKYLKAAQQLLDEVVNVRKALKQHDSMKEPMKNNLEEDEEPKKESTWPTHDSVCKPKTELSAAEKQDLQNKLIKLMSMLDGVDRRYKQYYHQMQIVVSSFDTIAGSGAAKPYTALALQTISRHFRSLRDAITGQIKLTRKNLGEEDISENNKGVGISRLRYVDQHLRQQKALQQLGMMQQHAWRPQRGLPESSVSILRAWLFEHFLHPYPKDSDKITLARQTGLTRSQVSNWFINARVRLWKPMVEEMYKEEFGDAEMDSNSSSEVPSKAAKGDIMTSEDGGKDLQRSATSTGTVQLPVHKPDQGHDLEMVGVSSETEYGVMRMREEQRPQMDDGSNLFPDTIWFGGGNGVSLTLGLQHHEDQGLPICIDTRDGFVTVRSDVYNAASSSVVPEATDFDCMDSGNRQHRFGSSHLLHDFVA